MYPESNTVHTLFNTASKQTSHIKQLKCPILIEGHRTNELYPYWTYQESVLLGLIGPVASIDESQVFNKSYLKNITRRIQIQHELTFIEHIAINFVPTDSSFKGDYIFNIR